MASHIQDMFLIYNEKMLHESLSKISLHNGIRACNISTLEIDLSTISQTKLLNSFLATLSELDTLTVRVASLSEASSSEILHNANFPRLQNFATTLHHVSLIGLLRRHPSITSLHLGKCGSERCPIPSSHCPNLSEITGPVNCVAAVSYMNPVRILSAKYHRTIDSLPPLYMSMRSSTANITRLQLDFPPTDHNILRSIRLAAPGIISLKLTEIPSLESDLVQRPWHQLYWTIELQLLVYLKTLLISTAASLVDIPGDPSQELALIREWANDPEHCHRQLDTIAIWYSRGGPGEHLSWFARKGWVWVRDRCHDSPADEEF